MARQSKEDVKKLNTIKERVESSMSANKHNVNRFFAFKEMVFNTSIIEEDRQLLKSLNKPPLEFNLCRAPVARLCGEYSKQEPDIIVTASDGAPVDIRTVEVVEGRIRHILYEANQKNTQYDLYEDALTGGFSNMEITVDYEHEKSFDQEIYLNRCDEPTLVGFDPADMTKTKSKSEYYFKLVPMPESQFKEEFPKVDIKGLKYSFLNSSDFSWAYKYNKSKVIIVCYYFEKTKKATKIYKLANGKIVTEKQYEEMEEQYSTGNIIEAMPAIVDDRDSFETKIKRYICCANEIIEKKDTLFESNSIIFTDGAGQKLRQANGTEFTYFTVPYTYHLAGLQKLTNAAGQTIAADLMNMTMHKYIIAEEALPSNEGYLRALTNMQLASTIVYKAYGSTDQQKPNPPPVPVSRVGLPGEVMETYANAMPMLQNILGSYDASLGINNNQLSGVAIVEGATQSNAAAMPYVVNQLAALNQAAQLMLQLFPLIYKTPRTIPIINKEGEKEYIKINQPGGVDMNYDHSTLGVKLQAGVNFEINKNQSLKQMIEAQNANPVIAKFIGDEGVDIMLDNMSFRGVEILKDRYKEWKQAQQQEQQQAMQNNPDMINANANMTKAKAAAANVMVKARTDSADNAVKLSQQAIDKEKADNDRLKTLSELHDNKTDMLSTLSRSRAEEHKANVEANATIVDSVLRVEESKHNRNLEIAKMAHDVIKEDNNNE